MSEKHCPITANDLGRIVFEFTGKHFEPMVKQFKNADIDWSEEQNANSFFTFMSENVDADLPKLSVPTLVMIYAKLREFLLDCSIRQDEVITHVNLKTTKSELLSFALRELLPRMKPKDKTRSRHQ